MNPPFNLDQGALDLAISAFTHFPGTPNEQLAAGLAAYQFALDARVPAQAPSGGWTYRYPTRDDVMSMLEASLTPYSEEEAN